MQPAESQTPTTQGTHLLIVGVQIVLTLVAVLVSRMGLGVRLGGVAVMGIAAVNGAVVATTLLGVRRAGTIVSLFDALDPPAEETTAVEPVKHTPAVRASATSAAPTTRRPSSRASTRPDDPPLWSI